MSLDTPGPASGRGWRWEMVAVGVALLGVVIRCRTWPSVFTDAGVVVSGVDPFYHLWRAQHLIKSLPSLPIFDPFISFPAGAPIPWPPGFDVLVGLPVFFGGGEQALARWGSVLVALLGGTGVYLVWRLGRRLFDATTGMVAAGFMAAMTGAVGFSELGRVDHHALVAPVVLGLVLSFLSALRSDTTWQRLRRGCVCGLLACAMVASWIVTPALYFLPVPLALLFLGRSDGAQARQTAWCVLVPAAVSVLLVVLLVADLDSLPFSLYQPSWFTVYLFAGMAAVVIPRFYRLRVALLAWSGLVAIVTALVCLVPASIQPIEQALRVVRGDDPSYLMAWESSRLFEFRGVFTFGHLVAMYTHLLLLAPFAWVVLLWRARVDRPVGPERVVGLVFIGFGLVLLFVQERFGEFSAPAVALLFGWSLVAGARAFARFARKAPSRARARVWGALLIVGLGFAISPLVTDHIGYLRADRSDGPYQLAEFGRLLAAHTPQPDRHGRGPDYGILTGWGQSHPLLWHARRPVVVSSFATPEALRWNRVGFRILLAADEEEAMDLARAHRIRYLVVTAMHGQANDMARIAGMPVRFVQETVNTTDATMSIAYHPLPPFTGCILSRMYVADGSSHPVAGIRHRPLSHLRLHLESAGTLRAYGLELPRFKAFEVVAGARLEGTTVARARVQLGLRVRTNNGREFVYLRHRRADPDGHFIFTVPYATRDGNSPVAALGPYRIMTPERTCLVDVSEEQVREGVAVPVECTSPTP